MANTRSTPNSVLLFALMAAGVEQNAAQAMKGAIIAHLDANGFSIMPHHPRAVMLAAARSVLRSYGFIAGTAQHVADQKQALRYRAMVQVMRGQEAADAS